MGWLMTADERLSVLADLRLRLRRANGPCRVIDALVHVGMSGGYRFWSPPDSVPTGALVYGGVPPYSNYLHLGAVYDLVRRRGPADWSIAEHGGIAQARIGGIFADHAGGPSLALLQALTEHEIVGLEQQTALNLV